MKRFVILGLKILGGLLAVVIVLLLAATLVLNSRSFQQKMLSHATELLEEKLQTKVSIDSININFLKFNVGLYGLDVEDREHRQMLQVERLAVNLDFGVWLVIISRLPMLVSKGSRHVYINHRKVNPISSLCLMSSSVISPR